MGRKQKDTGLFADDPLWFKDAIIYEVHVRAFCDSNADGIGDFPGLTSKLDYLQDLGVTALWLLPFYPSPLRDDGYDIAEYYEVNPIYGTLDDFKEFLSEAHRRGLRVITELVINHTSDQNPWFKKSRQAKPGTKWRDFYVWSDTKLRYSEARIIFKDFEPSNWTWDPVANAYFWHRFYSHQPDLNFDNPEVLKEVSKVLDYWLAMGVDGLRLDAVPYLYEREGTNCENLPETHAALKKLRAHMDARFRNRIFLAEANQWPEDASAYFGEGDEAHMNFHFPLMPRMFMALRMEDRTPIIDILEQTPAIPPTCQWANFLRNHDELTLEMVTDEERDYMYRVYAENPRARINLGIRRRLAPLVGRDRRRMELMNALLFSLGGTPVMYYGDEIAMGDNIYLGDRNGVRTPMQWSSDRNAGFSRGSAQGLYLPVITEPEYHYETLNVEVQQANPSSILWWMKRIIALRKQHKAFGQGTLEFLHPENRKILAFLRAHEGDTILVVASLSRYVEFVELDLSRFAGATPLEMFGETPFPPVGSSPYFLTLAPHAFYWFQLTAAGTEMRPEQEIPSVSARGSWLDMLECAERMKLEDALEAHLPLCRWFRSKARRIKSARLKDFVEIPAPEGAPILALLDVEYASGEPEMYSIPISFAPGEEGERLARELPRAAVFARIASATRPGVLYDGAWDRKLGPALLEAIERRRRFKGGAVELAGKPMPVLRELDGAGAGEAQVFRGEQSNTSLVFGDKLMLKLIRRLEQGIDPDCEIKQFLHERTSFRQAPRVAGVLELRRAGAQPMLAASLEGYVPNSGDAWKLALDMAGRYFADVLALGQPAFAPATKHLLESLSEAPPAEIQELISPFAVQVEKLGARTAEMHLALASDSEDPAFAPEPFNSFHQRSVYQTIRTASANVFHQLRTNLKKLPEASRKPAERALALEPGMRKRFEAFLKTRIHAMRTRRHGDYHLGQVLCAGTDFVVIDFEGEPGRPLGERRLKRSPLVDVAGMLRSFHYAAGAALLAGTGSQPVRPEDVPLLAPWGRAWVRALSIAFLRSYLARVGDSPIVPASLAERKVLLDAYLIEKAIYEIAYELNNRPAWLPIPIAGIEEILEAHA